jgi:23S rRNA pseudouridine1911/1915/1917 synthase
MPLTRHRVTVTADQAGRVDLIVQQATKLPRRQIKGLFDHGCVRVNGILCERTFQRVAAGDVIEAQHNPHQRYHRKKQTWRDPHFRVVYEDEHVIVVDKAADILTTPTQRGEEDTLIHRVSLYLTRGRRRDKAFACHRLDRGVSGLLVIAKTADIARRMHEQFKARKLHRIYIAIVAGQLAAGKGTFQSHIATAENLNQFSTDDPDGDGGQLAITHYQVIKTVEGSRQSPGATVVRVTLETGRRNQIRVHFAEAGHPVLGDPRYRPDLSQHPRWKEKRQALHAAELGFAHPVTLKPLKFQSPLPEPMRRLARM